MSDLKRARRLLRKAGYEDSVICHMPDGTTTHIPLRPLWQNGERTGGIEALWDEVRKNPNCRHARILRNSAEVRTPSGDGEMASVIRLSLRHWDDSPDCLVDQNVERPAPPPPAEAPPAPVNRAELILMPTREEIQ